MKKATFALVMASLMLLGSCAKTTEVATSEETTTTAQATKTSETTTEAATEATTEETTIQTAPEITTTEPVETEPPTPPEGCVVPEGYTFVWSDEFDGDELSKDNWNTEHHSKGYVNNELQEYTWGTTNVYVEDGDLVIQPLKEVSDSGEVTYTSGRINSYQNASFLYGYFEARIKVPEGKGFLPAFWMLPSKNTYGGWPLSGEIDIMEVVGGNESTTYSTLHYGLPHDQTQGSTSISGKLSDDYHIYACEWVPGKMSFYLDGEKFFETSDWFCTTQLGVEKDYPAPFDGAFYFTLNVAVGGDWPGDPDESTMFDESAQMRVDYVRVYQMDSYDDSSVVKPS